jgi:hypothetical protein
VQKNETWEVKLERAFGLNESGDTMHVFQLWWPKELMTEKKDGKICRFGCKAANLEMIRDLLPFLFIPEQLKSDHIVIKVDNLACVYGSNNHYMKGKIYASILTRGLHLISAYLGSVVKTFSGAHHGKVWLLTTSTGIET